MKYCKNCDKSFSDDNSFCPKCGKELSIVDDIGKRLEEIETTETKIETPKTNWKIIAPVIIVLMIVSAVVIWQPWKKTGSYIQGGIDSRTSTTTTTNTIIESTTTIIDETKYDLSEFPYPFVVDGKVKSVIVIGNDAPPTDVVVGVNIAASLVGEKDKEGVSITNTIAMLDTEVDNLTKQPMILIGGPDVNRLTASVLGIRYPSSMSSTGLPEDAIVIKIINNAFGGEYPVLIVDGCDDESTRLAGNMIVNYKDYKFKGDDFIIEDACSGKTLDTYSMNVGDSVTVDGKTVTLENVGSTGSVRLSIDGTLYTVSATGTVDGIEITVDDYFYMDSISDRGATLIIKKSSEV